jgi:hypothetical protein
VLVDYASEIDVPFAAASRIVLDRPEHWLPGVAAGAQQTEGALLADVGFEVAHVRVDKKVRIEILQLVRKGGKVVLLIRWQAHGGEKLFPIFEGALELRPADGERSRLLMNGEYQPPGGEAGKIGDRALLHRVAEATVKDFGDRVGAILAGSREAPSGPAT